MKTQGIFERVHSIKHEVLTKENWFDKQPGKRITLGGVKFMLNQPWSTFWVYFLGVLVTIAGAHFLWNQEGQISRYWWGISLILWGVGALIAGTSYQALGYELKCARRETCSWTTWWEVIYLIFQQVSMNAMTIAVAYSCTSGLFREALIWYSIILSILYTLSTLYGAVKPNKSLITFELMILVSLPSFVMFCLLNLGRYLMDGNVMDLVMLGSWALIFLSWWGYDRYDKAGLTEKLWQKGRWFSENDVLHVVLVIWGFYTLILLPQYIYDYSHSQG
ncbi:hypothetical protein [Vibrio hippocampi]|uniref:Uncharacterized protein n=1 Tax=Vibrio hippocampi TaxID=654686 RepID=A0ABN8DH48_9VIBR|nr:hypothetical protein [Vibrio hippocampi]CAH0525794.1 hypothetical protein VHP8226_01325 [Vibrio hippocampi]